MAEVRILCNYKKEIEFSEIDFDLFDELKLTEDELDNKGPEIISWADGSDNHSWEGEQYAINIDKAIDTLKELKELGSTHTEIMYHCDHIGYVFNGLEMRRATPKEIEIENALEMEKSMEGKAAKIAELQAEIDRLNA